MQILQRFATSCVSLQFFGLAVCVFLMLQKYDFVIVIDEKIGRYFF
jgi:hypothetical protein